MTGFGMPECQDIAGLDILVVHESVQENRNPMTDDVSRRNFMKTSVAAAAIAVPGLSPVLGANNRLKVGWIGTGMRGYHVMGQMYLESKDLVEVVAVCDTFAGNLAKGKDRVQTEGGNTPKTYVDYKELLADPSIDVVFIATPEHLHYRMAMDALKAGKNIYLEKPIGHTIEEGADIVRTAEKSGKVVQVGTQNRSNKLYIRAKEMFDQGMLGEVHYVRAFWYRNFDPTAPVPAAWRYIIPADATEQNSDWKKFLGDAPKRPFDLHRYYQWRNYWDYSGGISTDLLVHQTDISNFVLNKTLPSTCMASGGIYMWGAPDDREVPDTLSAIYEYPDKFHLNYSCYFGNDEFGYGEQFFGHEGTLSVLNRQTLDYVPQKFNKKPIKGRAEVHLDYIKDFHQQDATADHVHNFLEAVLGKEKAIAPARAGQIAAIPGHMATLSYKNNKKIYWDTKTDKYHFS
jgi:predicted dehydrogenase